MTSGEAAPVKAFISYSWTSNDHIAWVIRLAEKLMADGVMVILDKWDLHPGHDAIQFMEGMVTDPTVSKVLMVCDRIYAQKANGREGGVGRETQILTPEIYEKADQNKYAALITERGDDGKPFLPAFYAGRQYIDFTSDDGDDTSYQELLRWIFGRPKYVRPKLGAVPSFITDPASVSTATGSKFKRADDAARSGQQAAGGYILDFGEALYTEFEDCRSARSDTVEWDEQVIKNAEMMRPGLQNLFHLVLTVARFEARAFDRILSLYEKLGGLMFRRPSQTSWNSEDYEAYEMIMLEAFLGMTAILIKERRFDLLGEALAHSYYIESRGTAGAGLSATSTFRVFCPDITSLRRRNERLQLRRADLSADILHETYDLGFPRFQDIMQADLLLYLRASMVPDGNDYTHWWPRTIIYADRFGQIELFARSESLSFFNSWAQPVFGPQFTIDEFKADIPKLHEEMRQFTRVMFGPNLLSLTNAEKLGRRT